jgi:glyoxylase-like metal-dependent hydrolase (beta-lactamase superfamily II)
MRAPPWYTRKKVREGLWAISEQGWTTAYLVVGKRRAFLVDSGWGIGNLRALAESLTDRPLAVVHTHGHTDHVSGSYGFETVYVGRKDLPLLRRGYAKSVRRKHSEGFRELLLAQGCSPREYARGRLKRIVPIDEGYVFDLGGRALEVMAVPGHTRGSICLIEKRERILFTGDSVLEGDIFVHLQKRPGLAGYFSSLEKISAAADRGAVLLPGHNRTPLGVSILHQLIAGTEDLLAGKRRGRPIGDGACRIDLGRAALLYRPYS